MLVVYEVRLWLLVTTHADLSLEKAKRMVHQREAVAQQRLQLLGDGSKRSPIVLEAVTAKARRGNLNGVNEMVYLHTLGQYGIENTHNDAILK